jgi:hypothetical protein
MTKTLEAIKFKDPIDDDTRVVEKRTISFPPTAHVSTVFQ